MALRLTRASSQKLSRATAPDYNSAYTFLTAFRPETTDETQIICAVRNNVQNYDIVQMNAAISDVIEFRQTVANVVGQKIGATTLVAGTWYYIALVRYSATQVELFVGTTPNNMASSGGIATLATVASRVAASAVEIGGLVSSSNYANGRMRYGRLFTSALTLDQIKTGAGSGLWAEWLMEDGTDTADTSGNSRPMTLTGTPTTEADDVVTWPQTTSDRRGITTWVEFQVPDAAANPPTAAFTHSQTAGKTIAFTDTSTDDGTITGWDWDFGDSSSSNLQNPTHVYQTPGTYTVRLTVTDDDTLTDEVTQQVQVRAGRKSVLSSVNDITQVTENGPGSLSDPVEPETAIPNADFSSAAVGLVVTFTDLSTITIGNIASWLWEFGDGTTSTEQHPVHTYTAQGDYIVTLTVSNGQGDTDGTSSIVAPLELPTVDFEWIDPAIEDRTVEFIGSVGFPVVSWAWDLGDSNVETADAFVHTYAAAGNYVVSVTVTDAVGQQATRTKTITVQDIVEPPPPPPPLPPTQTIPHVIWGVNSRGAFHDTYDFWHGSQAAGMTPSNCQSVLNGYKNANQPTFIRLWNDVGAKVNDVFNMAAWKTSVDRYETAGLLAFIDARGADGTVLAHIVMDDVASTHRWGRPITPDEVEEMAAYSKLKYPNLPAWVRARTGQLVGGTFVELEGCVSIYLFNRGGVGGAGREGGWDQQTRVADVEAYRDRELADRKRLNKQIKVAFGLNIVNGGDGSSGLFGDNGTDRLYRQSANELETYSGVLVPASQTMFQMWEYNPDPVDGTVSYMARADIAAALTGIKILCEGVEEEPPTPPVDPTDGVNRLGMGAMVSAQGNVTPVFPVTPANGQFAIAYVVGRSNSVTFQPAAPAGWTLRSVKTRGTALTIATYYKKLAGGEANPEFVLPAEWNTMSACIGVYSGVHASNFFDANDVTDNDAALATFRPAGIVTQTAKALAISFVASLDDNALDFSENENFALVAAGTSYHTVTGQDHSLGIADKFVATAGTVTNPSWLQTVNGPDVWAGITMALRPA